MSLKSILKSIGSWFSKTFNNIKDDGAKVAVSIVQSVKLALDSGLVTVLTQLIPGDLDDKIVAVLQKAIPSILADLLALEGLPDNATPDQIQAFILSVTKSIGGKDWQAQSEFWTRLGVELFKEIQTDLDASTSGNLSFAQIVQLIEETYQEYKDHVAGTDTSDSEA